MNSPAGALLGELGVDVGLDLGKLLAGFDQAAAAADRFDKMLAARVSQPSKNAQAATNALGAAEQRLMRSFDSTGAAAQRYARDIGNAQTRTASAGRQIESSALQIRRVLLASASTIAAAFGANEIVKLSDSYTSFTNRLRSAGLEGESLAQTQQKLFEIAQHYGVQLETTGNLFGRMSQASKELDASQTQIMRAVMGAAAAVRVYGADTGEANGALLQLSQMLGDVNVRSQEFNSVNQGARPILQAVANGIERFHGSIAKLRAEVNNGTVTSKEFFAGWLRGMGSTIAQADKLPLTIGASFTTLNNALGRYIGQTNEAWSATQRVGAAIAALANNLDTVMPILSAIVLMIGARYAAAMTVATVATVRKMAADAAAAAAATFLAASAGRVTTAMGAVNAVEVLSTATTERLAVAFTGAGVAANVAAASVTRTQVAMGTAAAIARGLGSSLLSALGGWVGIAIMAIVGAVYLFIRSAQQAQAEVAALNKHMGNAKRVLEETKPAAKGAADEIKGVGREAKGAADDMRAFAGATGEAAAQLRQLAQERRRDKLQQLQTAREDLLQDRANAEKRFREAQPGTRSENYGGQTPAQAQAAAAALADIQRIDKMLADIDARAKQVGATPLEAEVPLAATGGRDIPAEIKQYQTQLVAARNAHNVEAERTLIKEIKLRERIVELMKQGLSLEIAQAQAEAEKLGSGTAEPKYTSREQAIGIAGNELKGIGLRVSENNQFGGVTAHHPGMGDKAHGLFAIDVNSKPGAGETSDPIEAARMDALARQYQKRGFRVLFNGQVYEAGGNGPGHPIPAGENQHKDHLHMEAPASIVGRTIGRDGVGDAESEMTRAAEKAEQDRLRHLEEFNRESLGLDDDILGAKRDQTVDAAALAQLEKDKINRERDREKQETDNRESLHEYTAAQAAEIRLKNENLRTLQLHAVDLKEQERKEKESLQVQDAQHERDMNALKAMEEIARTAAERRSIERRILKAEEDYERAVLEAKIKSPFTTPIDKLLAQGALAGLDKKYGGQRAQLDTQSRDDLLGMDKGLTGGNFARNAQIEEVKREQDERLKIVQDALEAKVIKEREAADRIVEINREAAAKIRDIDLEQKTVRLEAAQQIADGLQQIATTIFGEHSKAARAMFIVSKGFAIAEAALKLQVAIANAAAIPFPANIPAIATAVALGASIIANIASITAQFDTGGWTGYGPRNQPAGVVHGQEFVVRAGPAAQHREFLETINAGRDPTRSMQGGGGMMGRLSISLHNHAPGVEHQAYQIGPGEVEIIARKVVHNEAPGVVAADMTNPNSKTSKALKRHTSANTVKR